MCTRLQNINQRLIGMHTKGCNTLRVLEEIEIKSIMKIEASSFVLRQNIEMLIQKMQKQQEWLVCLRNYLVSISNDEIIQNEYLAIKTSGINEYKRQCVMCEWLYVLDIIFRDMGGKNTLYMIE